jgi:hypothetical protein
MELVINLDLDDARILRGLLKKKAAVSWPPECDAYNRISETIATAQDQAERMDGSSGSSVPKRTSDAAA